MINNPATVEQYEVFLEALHFEPDFAEFCDILYHGTKDSYTVEKYAQFKRNPLAFYWSLGRLNRRKFICAVVNSYEQP